MNLGNTKVTYSGFSIGTIYNDNQSVDFPKSFTCAGYYCNQATCSVDSSDANYTHVSVVPTNGTVPDQSTRASTHSVRFRADTGASLQLTRFTCTVPPFPNYTSSSKSAVGLYRGSPVHPADYLFDLAAIDPLQTISTRMKERLGFECAARTSGSEGLAIAGP